MSVRRSVWRIGFNIATAVIASIAQLPMAINLAMLDFPIYPPSGSGDAIANFPMYEVAEPFAATSGAVVSLLFIWVCVKKRKRYAASPGMWFVLNPLTILFGTMIAHNVVLLVIVAKLSAHAVLP